MAVRRERLMAWGSFEGGDVFFIILPLAHLLSLPCPFEQLKSLRYIIEANQNGMRKSTEVRKQKLPPSSACLSTALVFIEPLSVCSLDGVEGDGSGWGAAEAKS